MTRGRPGTNEERITGPRRPWWYRGGWVARWRRQAGRQRDRAGGAERAICPQADSQPHSLCLPAEIWLDGGWQAIGRNERAVSFLAVKARVSPEELAVRVVLVGSLPGD